MNNMDYEICQVKTDDKALLEVRDLLCLVFPNRTEKFSFEYLKWLYAENPAGEIIGFNAYKDGILAAHYVTMPIFLNINGKKTYGVLSLNTATHPDHRGKRLFTILAEATYRYAAEHGAKFVIGVANANSTNGFIKNLHFDLIGSLEFKIGFGTKIYDKKPYVYSRFWDEELLEWRLKNPAMRYYNNDGIITSPIAIGFKKLICRNFFSLKTSLSRLHFRPANLYIGYGADTSKGWYFNLPRFIKHSPFNLIFRDLTVDKSLPKVTKDNILFELIDFDVA